MELFLSWSGNRACHVAKALHKWIPYIIQSVHPWMSDEDLTPGKRWEMELAKKLDSTNFGIICITPETINSPWTLFEAGALAKALGEAVVCPYLIDLDVRDLQGPLSQFNAVTADKHGTMRLIRTINKSLPSDQVLPENILKVIFDEWWPKLKNDIEARPPAQPGGSVLFSSLDNLGLEYLFENRGPALEMMSKYLEAEIVRKEHGEEGTISIVGTSMRGFLVQVGKGFHAIDILKRAVKSKCELRIMLLHPEIADYRAEVEHRNPGDIQREIISSICQIKEIGVPRESIRYFRLGPSVFGIATSDRMLLNPYPSAKEAHHGFTIIVRKTEQPMDIYQQYKTYHFDDLWREHSEPLPNEHWDNESVCKNLTEA